MQRQGGLQRARSYQSPCPDERASVEAGRTQEAGCRVAWLPQFLVRECGGPVGAGHGSEVAAQLLWRSGWCQAQEFEVAMSCDIMALYPVQQPKAPVCQNHLTLPLRINAVRQLSPRL